MDTLVLPVGMNSIEIQINLIVLFLRAFRIWINPKGNNLPFAFIKAFEREGRIIGHAGVKNHLPPEQTGSSSHLGTYKISQKSRAYI